MAHSEYKVLMLTSTERRTVSTCIRFATLMEKKTDWCCRIYIAQKRINRILFICVMLVELNGFVIKPCVPNNPVKILSRQNYSALLTPLKHSHSSFYTTPPPHTHTQTYIPSWFLNHRSGNWSYGMTRNIYGDHDDTRPLCACSHVSVT